MADLYLVERGEGPLWDHDRGRREQAGWDDHAAFMLTIESIRPWSVWLRASS